MKSAPNSSRLDVLNKLSNICDDLSTLIVGINPETSSMAKRGANLTRMAQKVLEMRDMFNCKNLTDFSKTTYSKISNIILNLPKSEFLPNLFYPKLAINIINTLIELVNSSATGATLVKLLLKDAVTTLVVMLTIKQIYTLLNTRYSSLTGPALLIGNHLLLANFVTQYSKFSALIKALISQTQLDSTLVSKINSGFQSLIS